MKTGTVKITSGIFKGKSIKTPGEGTHPMGERERLALFNMLGNNLNGLSVLDAYAGGGTLGIEALSRGADRVVFIEKSSPAARILKNNLEELNNFNPNNLTEVIIGDTNRFESNESFNLILVDPPYTDFETKGVCHLTKFLTREGRLVLSHPGEAPIISGLELLKTNKYAGAHLSVYVK